jgi:hypothetical protein
VAGRLRVVVTLPFLQALGWEYPLSIERRLAEYWAASNEVCINGCWPSEFSCRLMWLQKMTVSSSWRRNGLTSFPNLSETSETGTTDKETIRYFGIYPGRKTCFMVSRHVLAADLLIFLKPHAPESLCRSRSEHGCET